MPEVVDDAIDVGEFAGFGIADIWRFVGLFGTMEQAVGAVSEATSGMATKVTDAAAKVPGAAAKVTGAAAKVTDAATNVTGAAANVMRRGGAAHKKHLIRRILKQKPRRSTRR